jgi:hypothetical protein
MLWPHSFLFLVLVCHNLATFKVLFEVFSAISWLYFGFKTSWKHLGARARGVPCLALVIKKTRKKHLLIGRQLKTYGPIIQSLCMPNPTGETQLPGKPWQRWEKCAQVWRRLIYALLLTLSKNSTMHLYCAKNSEINK